MYDFLCGKIKYRITCHSPEIFINKLRFFVPINNIVKPDISVIEFTTGYRYRHIVENIAKENNAKAETLWSYGCTVIADKYKKRLGLWLGVLFSIFAISVSSSMIWEVRVSGNENVPKEDIVRQLKLLGVSEGQFINKDILETVYNDFLINEPRISWLSVNFDGTVAKVQVKETNIIPQRSDRERNINIVAKCDGHIRRIDVFDGTAEVVPGEIVTKGQLIISSFVETRKTGEYMRAARGNVWATTLHKYEIIIPKNHSVTNITSDNIKKDSLIVLGKKIPLYFTGINDANDFEVDYKVKQISLLGINLPVRSERMLYSRTITEKNDLTHLSAKDMAYDELGFRIERDLQNAEIVEIKEECIEEEERYCFVFELICIENISNSVDFELVDK